MTPRAGAGRGVGGAGTETRTTADPERGRVQRGVRGRTRTQEWETEGTTERFGTE